MAGRKLATGALGVIIGGVADPELVAHIHATTGLDEQTASRLIDDIVAFHGESVEEYVRRRHAELKLRGRKNDAIFAQLNVELAGRLVAAPKLSIRQLRRLIYG
jgi:hypothetical protein